MATTYSTNYRHVFITVHPFAISHKTDNRIRPVGRRERDIMKDIPTYNSRLPGTNVRSFLLRCTNGPLAGVGQRELHLVADGYEHARHRHQKFAQVRQLSLNLNVTRGERLYRPAATRA